MKGEVPIPVLANYFRVPYRGGIPIDYPGRDMLLQSRITNVSKNGVFVVTRNPLPKGSQFEVSFQLPGTSRPIQAECVVRWSTDSAAEGRRGVTGMGLEFTRIARKDRKSLEKLVKEFIADIRSRANDVAGAPKLDTPVETIDDSDPATLPDSFSTNAGDPFSDTHQEPRKDVFTGDIEDLYADLPDDTFTNGRPQTTEFFPKKR